MEHTRFIGLDIHKDWIFTKNDLDRGGEERTLWCGRTLGLFTAHITGNLVIPAAHIGGGGEAQIAPMQSVPVFIVMVGLTRLLAGGLESIGLASLRPLLPQPAFSASRLSAMM